MLGEHDRITTATSDEGPSPRFGLWLRALVEARAELVGLGVVRADLEDGFLHGFSFQKGTSSSIGWPIRLSRGRRRRMSRASSSSASSAFVTRTATSTRSRG